MDQPTVDFILKVAASMEPVVQPLKCTVVLSFMEHLNLEVGQRDPSLAGTRRPLSP